MKKIDIAFCFDENLWKQAGVAITSLLLNSAGKCGYNIYCVVHRSVNLPDRHDLTKLVREFDPHSSITFLDANADFDDSYTGGYSKGIYYRMMLPNLLPDPEKIIYADVDTLFLDSLADIEDINMTGCYVAGVKDIINAQSHWKYLPADNKHSLVGGYINSGFLILNLKLIRENGLYERWLDLSIAKKYNYPDQDILNITCKGKILHLPPRYNFIVWSESEYNEFISAGVYSREEYALAKYAPVMLHYCPAKPWKKPVNMGEKWWEYAKKTPFFETFLLKYVTPAKPKRVIKSCLLFSFIKILTIKEDENNIKYYLFGFIPIFRIRVKRH
jgi:lipopolysaccharide biosynthesis glycosyltransferase